MSDENKIGKKGNILTCVFLKILTFYAKGKR